MFDLATIQRMNNATGAALRRGDNFIAQSRPTMATIKKSKKALDQAEKRLKRKYPRHDVTVYPG